MSKWITTPFQDLEAARAVAEMLGSDPQPYDGTLPEGYEAFTSLDEHGGRLLVAQDVANGGPVRQRTLSAGPPQEEAPEPKKASRRRRSRRKAPLSPQDPSAPRWRHEDRKGVGPWTLSTHFDLDQAWEHTKLAVLDHQALDVVKGRYMAVTFADGDTYEYVEQAPGRVLVRVLSRGTAPPPQEGVTPPVAAGGEESPLAPSVQSGRVAGPDRREP